MVLEFEQGLEFGLKADAVGALLGYFLDRHMGSIRSSRGRVHFAKGPFSEGLLPIHSVVT